MIELQKVVELVFGALKNDAAFSSAVGGRIFPDRVPQSAALPAAIVAGIDGVPAETLGGARVFSRCQVSVHLIASGSSFAPINGAAERADAVLQELGGTASGGVVVKLGLSLYRPYAQDEAGVAYRHIDMTYQTPAHPAP